MHMQKQLLADVLQLGFVFRLVIAPYPHENPLANGAPFKIRVRFTSHCCPRDEAMGCVRLGCTVPHQAVDP